jgi:hypothetical protein
MELVMNGDPRHESRRGSADQRLDFGGLATLEMLRVWTVAVYAMIAEPAAPPDEIVDGALELRGAILQQSQSGFEIDVRAVVLGHAGT